MANSGKSRVRPSWMAAALGTALGASLVGGILLTDALAVHGSPFPFELDGNVTNNGGNSLDDWQNVFELDAVTPPGSGTPHASGAEVFIRDLPPQNGQNKESQYDAGKDSLDLSGWTRKDVAKVVPDKDNITDAFAKQYMVDHDGNSATPEHRVIYFGADRFANNGDAALGFWFFQQRVQLTGTNGFSPNHTARNDNTGQRGDILVQVDFVSGGSNSQIQIFEWLGNNAPPAGTPSSKLFGGGTLLELAAGSANGNTVCLNGDTACATTNEVANIGSYWPYVPKSGSANRFPAESFFEGGIDITALVGDLCFNSFLANTRTSHSETADLKDLALGDFNTCGHIDLVRKTCEAETGVSPVYDASTELYQTKHVLTIRNDGLGGNVYDVAIRDDAISDDATCNIIAINGGIGNPTIGTGIPLPDKDTFVQVADQLAAGIANQMTVTLLCQATVDSFHNSATVQAGQVDGGTSLTDSYAEGGPEDPNDTDVNPQCHLELNPSVQITKSCDAVTLDAADGFKPQVCVDISIKNTSQPAQKVDIDLFKDYRMDGTVDDLIDQIPLVGGHRELQPGEQINITDRCYHPVKPDSDQTDPDLARYTNEVKADATGHASGTTSTTSGTRTCDLCPTGLDGPPTPPSG